MSYRSRPGTWVDAMRRFVQPPADRVAQVDPELWQDMLEVKVAAEAFLEASEALDAGTAGPEGEDKERAAYDRLRVAIAEAARRRP